MVHYGSYIRSKFNCVSWLINTMILPFYLQGAYQTYVWSGSRRSHTYYMYIRPTYFFNGLARRSHTVNMVGVHLMVRPHLHHLAPIRSFHHSKVTFYDQFLAYTISYTKHCPFYRGQIRRCGGRVVCFPVTETSNLPIL